MVAVLANIFRDLVPLQVENARNSMFARLGTDYEIRNQWFFAILKAITTD